MRNSLQNAPTWVVGVIAGSLFAVFTAVPRAVAEPAGLHPVVLAIYGVGGVLFGTVMALVVRRQRAAAGGARIFSAIQVAIRRGQVPPDADADVWLPQLARQERLQRLMRWVGPVEFGAFALLGVYVTFNNPADELWMWGGLTAAFAILAILFPFLTTRSIAKIDAVRRQLAPQPPVLTGQAAGPSDD